jgi:hypothetical protein
MNRKSSPLAAIHLVGEKSDIDSAQASRKNLRPALFANYGDLSKIRYDYPLLLISSGNGEESVKSLADITDSILQEIAPRGIEGEALRRQVLGLEQEIRKLLTSGTKGPLSKLWKAAQKNTDSGSNEQMSNNLNSARNALRYDGEVIDCDSQLPARLVTHLWCESQQLKSERLRARVENLAQKLLDILRVDFMHSSKARNAKHLKGSVGTADQTVFDFKAMSQVLRTAPVGGPLPKSRKNRIRNTISVLQSQQFVITWDDKSKKHLDQDGFNFAFEDCGKAATAFRERLPQMAALVKAISIAELEIRNRYDESKHDQFIDRFGENQLEPRDIAMFPSYLVCLGDETGSATEVATILEVLCSGIPIKIVAQSNKIIEDVSIASGQKSPGLGAQQLANMALGLNSVFVLQSSSSSLYRLREPVSRGLSGDCPALFSVFAGDSESTAGVAPYLCAAAATETRAFPCFVYDPDAGDDWASRFSLDGNLQVNADWPLHALEYEDAEHNRQSQDTALTLVDFAACDPRYVGFFDRIPESEWHDDMLPVAAFLQMDAEKLEDTEPYTLLIDENNDLYRAVVDARLIEAARRRRDLWRRLQELGGINNSHVAMALTEAETTWEQEKQQLLARAVDQVKPPDSQPAAGEGPVPSSPTEVAGVEAIEPETQDVPSDDPWIETIRCTTCNECTELNNMMFAYDDDMRAYIADPDAGTYRQLVEAAETCQVAIIHPGKPRNENEPNLDELVERGASFNA